MHRPVRRAGVSVQWECAVDWRLGQTLQGAFRCFTRLRDLPGSHGRLNLRDENGREGPLRVGVIAESIASICARGKGKILSAISPLFMRRFSNDLWQRKIFWLRHGREPCYRITRGCTHEHGEVLCASGPKKSHGGTIRSRVSSASLRTLMLRLK
jgi:hypothetical protein